MFFVLINFMPIQIDPIVARYADEIPEGRAKPWINSHSAKGFHLIEWKDRNPWYWFDRKTTGYLQVNYVGKLVLRGGNWTKIDDKTPRDVYNREVGREETAQTPAGNVVRSAVLEHSEPFADYLEISAQQIHGNPNKGTIYGITSVFATTIDGGELVGAVKEANPSFELTQANLLAELGKISKESGVAIVSTEQCKIGERMPGFAWGEDQKLVDFLKERGYVSEPKVPILPGPENYRLSTNPETPFSERAEAEFYIVNPLREQGNVKEREIFG